MLERVSTSYPVRCLFVPLLKTNHLPITDFGRVLLTILTQRTSDEIAKEFVELKTQCHRE